jgi:hypothetical protein
LLAHKLANIERKTSQNINHAPNKNQIFYHDQNVGRVASGHNPNNPNSGNNMGVCFRSSKGNDREKKALKY